MSLSDVSPAIARRTNRARSAKPTAEVEPATDGRKRAVIDRVLPAVDGGRFAVKRSTGETLEVLADAFIDGHEVLRVVARYRRAGESAWTE
ncbi:MAG: maltotransferase domain-containing protein, partial [Burkholderiaceae bacterium]